MALSARTLQVSAAGWSSQVARRAHNPKVRGSNPLPATKLFEACQLAGRPQTICGLAGFGRNEVTAPLPATR